VQSFHFLAARARVALLGGDASAGSSGLAFGGRPRFLGGETPAALASSFLPLALETGVGAALPLGPGVGPSLALGCGRGV
jgi:hypothetical protein